MKQDARDTVLIVGGAGYLGQYLVAQYQSQGEHVTIWDRPTLEFTGKRLNEQVEGLVNKLERPIKAVVFASGLLAHDDIFEVTQDDLVRSYQINVQGPTLVIKQLLPFLTSSAAIVLVASQNGVVAHEKRLSYGMMKAAVIQLTKQLQLDFAVNGLAIKVNCLSPGYIARDGQSAFEIQKLQQRIPLRRFVSLEEVGHVIQFLTSPASDGIRGQNIIVDNGYTII